MVSFFRVEIPKGKYKGQKLKKLVMIKMMASDNKMMAVVPEIFSAKYKPAITRAMTILTTLSKVPILFFIVLIFLSEKYYTQRYSNHDIFFVINVTQGKKDFI